MKLHLAKISGSNVFTGYGPGYVMINGERYERNLVVLRDRVVDWQADSFDGLKDADFAQIAELAPEIVLLGTGERLRFPHPSLTRALAEAGIGLEVMDAQAACRTFNILAEEERKVAAALLFS